MVSGHVATTDPQLVQKCCWTAGMLLRTVQLLLPLLLLVPLHLGLQNSAAHPSSKVTIWQGEHDYTSL